MRDILNILYFSIEETIVIGLIILITMIILELFVLKFENKLIQFFSKNRTYSYFIGSFFGIIPGCSGTFAMDALYMSGFISFGTLSTVFVSTLGDEGFYIVSKLLTGDLSVSLFLSIFLLLFIIGFISGFIADWFVVKFNIELKPKCLIKKHDVHEFKIKHFFFEHIYSHIIKKHLLKVVLWIFISIFLIEIVDKFLIIDSSYFNGINGFMLLFFAAITGLIPFSGPNLIFISAFLNGTIPFSAFIVNSIVQDGHGLLPILGFSFKDAFYLKLFNAIIGLIIGVIIFLLGF